MAINGNDVNEEVDVMIEVTSIKRSKREFEGMMRQLRQYCIINLPARRVIRSKNEVLKPEITSKHFSDFQRLRSSSEKKRKIDQVNYNVVQDEVKDELVIKDRWNSEKPLIQYTRRSKATAFVPEGIKNGDADDVDVESLSSLTSKPELLEISKEVEVEFELKKIPTRLKELLQTNLLEGLNVRYVKGFKTKVPGEADLQGKISGTSILCFCIECNGKKVVTPNQFEVHAGSRNKRPPEYIHLDNGKSFRDVLNLCQNVPLDSLEQQIKIAIGRADAQEGPIPQSAEHSGDSETVAADQTNDIIIARSSKSVPSRKRVGLSSRRHYRRKGQVKLTIKDLRLHKLVFDSDLLPDGTPLGYYVKGKKKLQGYKKGRLIHCTCCDREVCPSVFEHHADAGYISRRKPYLHIRNSDGVSLHELSIQIKKTMEESDDDGELLEASETECFLCRGCHFTESNFSPYTVIFCDQCEKEYHVQCLKEHGIDDLKSLPEEWCCSKECGDVYSVLRMLVNEGEQTLPPPMLSIIQKKQESVGAGTSSDLSLTWRLLNGKIAAEEHKKWLSGAVVVLNNRFGPIRYSNSRCKDLIPTMVYGETNGGKNNEGMYCAVLIQKSIVVCTAVFRIFGQELAEIPLVATRTQCQSKGFCQSLVGCIENLMASMNVKEVVLPASHEAEGFWKSKFGFEVLSDEQLRKYTRDYAVMLFEDTTMLHKSLAKAN